jgi:phage FluMu protein Com
MPRTIICQQCGAVLNLPAHIEAGKRLKCPKCAKRFVVSEHDASSASTRPGEIDAAPTSTHDLAKPPAILDDLPLPTAEGDLREALDLPLLSTEAEKSVSAGPRAAVGDAAALFKDDSPRRKKPTGAEARAHARRCSRCGGLVPVGMSLCSACGTDQDTGRFFGLDDDFAPPPPPPPTGPPLLIAIPGMLCGLAGAVLSVLALIQSVRVEAGVYQYGWLALGVVAGYGVYGAVQFLRGRSVKNLILALTLGVIVNIFALIALPLFEANFSDNPDNFNRVTAPREGEDASELADWEIKPLAERLDQQRITMGVVLIFLYAGMSIYLNSPPVKKYFARRQAQLQSISL